MKKIKAASLFLALSLMLCLLTGCDEGSSSSRRRDRDNDDEKYTSSQDDTSSDENPSGEDEEDSETEEKIIDPFENISFTVSGISPYCSIAINNSNCSDEVQRYVTYEFDKEFYANNETATITAKISGYTGNEEYELKCTEMEYTVEGQAEYLTALSDTDIAFIERELNDYIATRRANDTDGQFIFGYNAVFMSYIDSVTPEDAEYFSALKKIKYDQFERMDFFNCYSRLYSISYTTRYGDSHTIFVAISANNIVKYSDGTIKWGTNTLGDYDFICESDDQSLESCISIHIMGNSSDYNISQIN